MQWGRGFKSLQKWSNLYKMLNTCSVLRELGAALNIDTNCRRRRRKDSFLEDEAMMARLVWKAVPFLMCSSGIEPPNWLLAPTPSPEQQLYTESENKHTAWTAEMLLKHCKSAKLARRYNIKLSFLSLSCIHLFLSFCLLFQSCCFAKYLRYTLLVGWVNSTAIILLSVSEYQWVIVLQLSQTEIILPTWSKNNVYVSDVPFWQP